MADCEHHGYRPAPGRPVRLLPAQHARRAGRGGRDAPRLAAPAAARAARAARPGHHHHHGVLPARHSARRLCCTRCWGGAPGLVAQHRREGGYQAPSYGQDMEILRKQNMFRNLFR